MSKPEVTAQYLRWRMSAALLLVLMAALAVHQIGRATHHNAIVRSEITNMLDDAQAAIIDNVIHLSAIENAPDSQRAKSIRSEMRRSLRNLENSLEALGDDINAKAFGPDAMRILSNQTVEPFGLLNDFRAIVARLSKNEAAWGVASRRYVEAARTISRQVLPTIWRLKDLERSNLAKANKSLSY